MTPKQEQFARLYVETGNASEAYRQAYNADNMKPETVTNEAYKLLQDPDISAMVDDLKAEARQRHAVTVGDLLSELEQARAAALAAPTPQSSAAVSATMGKAKMLGLLVDKAEIKAEAEISTKQEEYTPPLTGDEVQQVIKSFFKININLLGTDLVPFGTPLYSYGYAQKIGAVPNGTKVKICVLVP